MRYLLGAAIVAALFIVPASAGAHGAGGLFGTHGGIDGDSRLHTPGGGNGTVMMIGSGGWFGDDLTNPAECGGNDSDNPFTDWASVVHGAELHHNGTSKKLTNVFAQNGWQTYTVGVSGGYQCSFEDALAWYDYIKQEVGGPICVYGASGGAHLALLVASQRNTACVVGQAAPTALRFMTPTLEQLAADGDAQDSMGVLSDTQKAFWSPTFLADAYPGIFDDEDILLGHAYADPVVGWKQTQRFDGSPETNTVTSVYMGTGSCYFTHVQFQASCGDVSSFVDEIYSMLN